MSDKEITLTSSPETEPKNPTPPIYESLWPASQIRADIEALVTYRGHAALSVVNLGEIIDLVIRKVGEYDKALYLAQFENYTFGRVTEGSIDLEEDAK